MKKHKIKSYKETFYRVVEKNGEIQKGDIAEDSIPLIPSSTKIVFNKHGNKIEESWFNTNEGLLLKNTYKYDRKRNIVEQGGSFKKKFTYEYDEKGNKTKEIICDFDGGLICTITYVFDEKGNKTERNVYDSKGNLERKYSYKFDDLFDNFHQYKYDQKGNWIEKIEYENDVPKVIIEREIEYY